MSCIVAIATRRPATLSAVVALDHLRLCEERHAASRAQQADLRRALEAARKAAGAAMRTLGPCEWTSALYRRRDALMDLSVTASGLASGFDLMEARRRAGRALACISRADARRLYAEAFPGLTRQKLTWRLDSLLSAERMSRRVAEAF